MKKVAIIYQGAKYYGGIETYLEQLFSNIDRQKLELTLISLGSWELTGKLESNNEKVMTFPFAWYRPWNLRLLAKFLEENNFDLIVSQGLVSNFVARLLSAKTKIPNLVTIHSDYKFDFHGAKKMLFWLTFKLFAFITKKYLVVSKYLETETQKLGIPKEKISVVYNGLKDLPPQKKTRKGKVILGSLGRLHYKKGYHNLILAMDLLKEENIELLIWGEGEERRHLEELIKKIHLVDMVELKGFSSDIEAAFKEVDIYVQPSLEEGFGLTVAEAMLAEKPIIVTSAGSLPELIKDEKTGLVSHGTTPAALAAAIKVLILDNQLANNLAAAARKEALKRFSLEKWLRETEKVYLETAK